MSRILLTDHDRELIDGFETALKRHGFDVATTFDQQSCVLHLYEFAPTVWVLEPDVRGSWGWQLLVDRNVRRPPTVIVSRFCETQAGVGLYTTWLTKPISTACLVLAIQAATDTQA